MSDAPKDRYGMEPVEKEPCVPVSELQELADSWDAIGYSKELESVIEEHTDE